MRVKLLLSCVFLLFVPCVLAQPITPQIGGGISSGFDGGISGSSGGSGGTPLAFLRVVSPANSAVNPAGLSVSGSNTNFAFRVPIEIANDAARIVFSFNTKALFSGGANNGNALSILDCALDNGANAVQVNFSGSSTTTLPDGSVDFQSDPINPLPGKSRFTSAEIYYVKLVVSAPATTGKVPYSTNASGPSVSGFQTLNYNPASTTMSAAVTPGAFTFTGSAPGSPCCVFSPIILGYPYVDKIAIIATGDSEISAISDSGCAACINGNGYYQRGLTALDGVSNPRPAMNFSSAGLGTAAFIGAGNTAWTSYIKYANVGFNGLGTNDPGTTIDQQTATQLSIVQLMRAGGLVRMIRPELFPNTTSTDSFATVVNQTPVSGWGPGQVISQLQTWFSTKVNDAIFTGLVGASDLRDAGVPTSWQANGTTFLATPDGKHPSVAYHTIHGTTFRNFLATFPTADPAPSALPPVLNPFDKDPGVTLSNGNLTATQTLTNVSTNVRATTPVLSTQKKIWRVTVNSGAIGGIEITNLSADLSTCNNANCLTYTNSGGLFFNGQITGLTLPSYAVGDAVDIAIDGPNLRMAARNVTAGGNWNGNVANDPAVGFVDLSGAGRFPAGSALYPTLGFFSLAGQASVNFTASTPPTGYSLITGGGV